MRAMVNGGHRANCCHAEKIIPPVCDLLVTKLLERNELQHRLGFWNVGEYLGDLETLLGIWFRTS